MCYPINSLVRTSYYWACRQHCEFSGLKWARKAPVAEWLRMLIFNAVNRSSSHRCVRQAKFCLRVVRWFFSGFSCFHPTFRLTRLKMIGIILMGRRTQFKKNNKMGKVQTIQGCILGVPPSLQFPCSIVWTYYCNDTQGE